MLSNLPFIGNFPLTQSFGDHPERYIDISCGGVPLRGHNGLDFATPLGTPVVAVEQGVVLETRDDPDNFGRFVLLGHEWGQSLYAHLSEVRIGKGQSVSAEQQLGLSGNSGNSLAPHLHFGMRITPFSVADSWCGYSDPQPYLDRLTQPCGAIIGPHIIGDVHQYLKQLEQWQPRVVLMLDPNPNEVALLRQVCPATKVIGRIFVPDIEIENRIRANPQEAAHWAHDKVMALKAEAEAAAKRAQKITLPAQDKPMAPFLPHVDYWQFANEILQIDDGLPLLNTFEMERMALAEANNYRCAILAFSVGNPALPEQDRMAMWRMVYPAIERAEQHGHVVAVHQCGAPDLFSPAQDWYAFRLEHQVLRRLPYKKVKFAITEYGIDGLIEGRPQPTGWQDFTDADGYVEQLLRAGRYLERFSGRILGYAVFTLGSNTPWRSYDIAGDVANKLAEGSERGVWSQVNTSSGGIVASESDQTTDPGSTVGAGQPAILASEEWIGVVTAIQLNVRQGPGTEHAQIGSLSEDDTITVTGRVGDWLRVNTNGRTGFVHSQWVRRETVTNGGATTDDIFPPPTDQLVEPPAGASEAERALAARWNKYGGLLLQHAAELAIDPAVALAILMAESRVEPFGPNGRMIIRFENHIFFNLWGQVNEEQFRRHFRFDPNVTWQGHQWRPDPNGPWQDCHTSQDVEWQVLDFARRLDDTAALSSISMGAPQIMGFNHAAIGYSSVQEMFHAFQTDVRNQTASLFRFIQVNGLAETVRQGDYVAFARVYNGPGQAENYAQIIRNNLGAFRLHSKPISSYALLVGIDHYANPPIPSLSGCAQSVIGLQSYLADQLHLFPERVLVLTDEAATRANILQSWRAQVDVANEGDHLFFVFAGHGSRQASSNPDSPTGYNSTLVAHDSRMPNITDILDWELVDVVQAATAKGVKVIMLLDCAHAGSETIINMASEHCLILTACREDQVAFAPPPRALTGGGFITYLLQEEILKRFFTSMTWADIYDQVLAELQRWNIIAERQTPQLIGPANLEFFGNLVAPLPPYLIVMALSDDARRVKVNASIALGLTERTRLAIYPPASNLAEAPLAYANVDEIEADHIWATLESPEPVKLASRVRIATYGERTPPLIVGYDQEIGFEYPSDSIRIISDNTENIDFRLRQIPPRFSLDTPSGETLLYIAPPSERATDADEAVSQVLQHLALFKRLYYLSNTEPQAALDGALHLEIADVEATPTTTTTAGQTFTLHAYNHAVQDLYVSIWLFTPRFEIQRIYPTYADCQLIGSKRKLQLPVVLDLTQPEHQQEQVVFKVFASKHPHNLDILQLPSLDTVVRGIEFTAVAPPIIQSVTSALASDVIDSVKVTDIGSGVDRVKTSKQIKPGAGIRAKLWKPGQTLRVRFLDGDPTVQEEVQPFAHEWEQYANLKFVFGNDPDAEIRISFSQPGSWSYIGTDALTIAKSQPTMNLGQITPTTVNEEIRRLVLHEFGHVLGLIHEHQNPNAEIPWDREKAYAYYGNPPTHWSKAEVDLHLFKTFDPNIMAIEKPFDPDSIMLFPIPTELTQGDFEIGLNRELSVLDKESVAKLYPYRR